MARRKVIVVLASAMVTGCAFSQRWVSHYPNSYRGWSQPDEFGFTQLSCTATKIRTSPAHTHNFTLWGPPLLPVIPIYLPWIGTELVFHVEGHEVGSCPAIKVNGSAYGAELNDLNDCRYAVGKLSENALVTVYYEDHHCDKNTLEYTSETEWKTDLLWTDFD